ncbi:ribonuclease H-like domain-containing protein [Mortierella sp. GBAus27b]|nr:exosome nuclease subunit [Mortierella sp. GBA43]KAI8362526.1 ribonuclease H-like domain-containing protein [Mortierella sp. GBAus27b]
MATANILADFDAWQTELFATLVKATKASNALPGGDVSFYKTLDPSFAADMNEASGVTLDLCNKLLLQAGGPSVDLLGDHEDVDDRFHVVVDVVDNMLEKVDIAIDDMTTSRKKGVFGVPQSAPLVASAKSDKLEYRLVHAQNIARPQLRFPDPVDNSSSPFVRKITYKPHAKVDLSYGMDSTSELGVQPHPYEYEIKHIEYPERMFQHLPEQLYTPFDTTSAIWVETEEDLKDMCRALEMQQEIAIDLEHHNYRSFQGFSCLMQISTRDQDYIVDTLELRGSLHLLNQSFTDPNIVKVLHGAEYDIIWLQRDFGVYIVNMFDTYHASKLLELGSYSLAHLLKYYADFEADKRYQLADWRIRPLPKEMLMYARADTHFLLYIYDRLRNSLLEKSNPTTHNLLRAALERSATTCLNLHEKEIYDAEGGNGSNGWRNMYSKWSRSLDTTQFAVLKALHAWRDQTAREEDESLRYVLPNSMLFTLAEQMPEEATKVLACCNPVPPIVRMNATDIAMLITLTKASVVSAMGVPKLVEMQERSHVRFNTTTGLMESASTESSEAGLHSGSSSSASKTTGPLEKAGQAQGGQVVAATSSTMFGKSLSGQSSVAKALTDPKAFMTTHSRMFGGPSSGVKRSKVEEDARMTAKRIIEELSTQPVKPAPKFKEITQKTSNKTTTTTTTMTTTTTTMTTTTTTTTIADSEAQEEKSEDILFIPKEERATKTKRTDVLVLSNMSKKRSRAIDEDRAELEKEAKDEPTVDEEAGQDAESSNVTPSESAGGEVAQKKKSRKKKKGSGTAASSAASSAPVSGDEAPEAFKPFDYSTVQSVVDQVVDSATSSSSSRRKNKKKKSDGAPEAAPFDPYSKMEEHPGSRKKDPSFSRNPKSGARSMTFGKNQ